MEKRVVKVLEVYDGRFRGESVNGRESRKGTAYGMFSFDKIRKLDTLSPFVASLMDLPKGLLG